MDHENDLINDVMEQLFFYQLTMQMKITGRRSISMVHLYKWLDRNQVEISISSVSCIKKP